MNDGDAHCINEPEMGHVLFGQPRQEYECPRDVVGFLRLLGEAVSCNNSPCDNTGERYENDVFELHAYSWDEDVPQRYNFRWRDVEVSWYKYLGRGTTINQVLTSKRLREMREECMASVLDIVCPLRRDGEGWKR